MELGDNMFVIPTNFITDMYELGNKQKPFILNITRNDDVIEIENEKLLLLHHYVEGYDTETIDITGRWTIKGKSSWMLQKICNIYKDRDICFVLCDNGMNWSIELEEILFSHIKGFIECEVEWNEDPNTQE